MLSFGDYKWVPRSFNNHIYFYQAWTKIQSKPDASEAYETTRNFVWKLKK